MNLSFSSRLLSQKTTTSVYFDMLPSCKMYALTNCLPRLLGCNNLRRNCWVVEIDLSNRLDVSGSLDKDFKELKYLAQLSLENTKASGDIAMLRNNTKLDYLNLDNTSVFGDLAALQKATELQSLNLHNTSVFGDLAALQKATHLKDSQNFEVSNTGITCPQEAALKAVLIKLGFQEQQLKDLHAMEGLAWMLSCRSSSTFYCLAAHGVTNKFFGEDRQKL